MGKCTCKPLLKSKSLGCKVEVPVFPYHVTLYRHKHLGNRSENTGLQEHFVPRCLIVILGRCESMCGIQGRRWYEPVWWMCVWDVQEAAPQWHHRPAGCVDACACVWFSYRNHNWVAPHRGVIPSLHMDTVAMFSPSPHSRCQQVVILGILS